MRLNFVHLSVPLLSTEMICLQSALGSSVFGRSPYSYQGHPTAGGALSAIDPIPALSIQVQLINNNRSRQKLELLYQPLNLSRVNACYTECGYATAKFFNALAASGVDALFSRAFCANGFRRFPDGA